MVRQALQATGKYVAVWYNRIFTFPNGNIRLLLDVKPASLMSGSAAHKTTPCTFKINLITLLKTHTPTLWALFIE